MKAKANDSRYEYSSLNSFQNYSGSASKNVNGFYFWLLNSSSQTIPDQNRPHRALCGLRESEVSRHKADCGDGPCCSVPARGAEPGKAWDVGTKEGVLRWADNF